jgi:hypothetical protein
MIPLDGFDLLFERRKVVLGGTLAKRRKLLRRARRGVRQPGAGIIKRFSSLLALHQNSVSSQ